MRRLPRPRRRFCRPPGHRLRTFVRAFTISSSHRVEGRGHRSKARPAPQLRRTVARLDERPSRAGAADADRGCPNGSGPRRVLPRPLRRRPILGSKVPGPRCGPHVHTGSRATSTRPAARSSPDSEPCRPRTTRRTGRQRGSRAAAPEERRARSSASPEPPRSGHRTSRRSPGRSSTTSHPSQRRTMAPRRRGTTTVGFPLMASSDRRSR